MVEVRTDYFPISYTNGRALHDLKGNIQIVNGGD